MTAEINMQHIQLINSLALEYYYFFNPRYFNQSKTLNVISNTGILFQENTGNLYFSESWIQTEDFFKFVSKNPWIQTHPK